MMHFARLCLFLGIGLSLLNIPLAAQQPLPPDQQAEAILKAARKGYSEGNYPFARDRFQEVVTKFGNLRQATAARYGLALCYINAPEQDFAKAIENLNGPSGDGSFTERASALYLLGICHRSLGLKEQQVPQANQRFSQAQQAFQNARDVYQQQKNDELSARCRCDIAEMELRQNRIREARNTCEPFTKDAALAKNKYRKLGLYYHGLACFLDKDYNNAGRSLNQIAPFTDPAYGMHAEYLIGRVMHMSNEPSEASVHYDAVIANYGRAKKAAIDALKQPDRFKGDPFEKTRLEALVKNPPPDYVVGSIFHTATLTYDAKKYAEALTQFQSFLKEYSTSPLAPDASLRVGLCQVHLKQFDDATKQLTPVAEKTPRLADQAYFWLAKAQLGLAAKLDSTKVAEREAMTKTAIATFRTAADKANQLIHQEPEARVRRHEILFELADALQQTKQYPDAAGIYETLWNEQALPNRREQLLQRIGAALGSAGQWDRSLQRGAEFRRLYPQSALTPAVLFQQAESAYALAASMSKDRLRVADMIQRYEEAAGKYKELVEKYPEFERVHHARLGLGVCAARLNTLDEAIAALETIPAEDRAGELAATNFVLADCLVRQVPLKPADAAQTKQAQKQLTHAATLFEQFCKTTPKAPETPAALLKMGHAYQRVGKLAVDANERNVAFSKSRESFERLQRDFPKDLLGGQALVELARVKAAAGDRGGAINDLRAFTQREELKTNKIAPMALLHLATLLREQNQSAEAVPILDAARNRYDGELQRDPERADWVPLLKYHHAVALMETGKEQLAIPMFDQIIGQTSGKPIHAEAALRRGQCRISMNKKQLEIGQQAMQQAGTDNNKKNAARQTIERSRQALVDTANQLYVTAEQSRITLPNDLARARMYYDTAWVWRTLADTEPKVAGRNRKDIPAHEQRAHIAYKRLIEEFSDSTLAIEARYELAELLDEHDDHEAAQKLFQDALDREPTDHPKNPEVNERIRLRQGAVSLGQKDYAAALKQFETITKNAKSPYIAQALYRAAECDAAMGNPAKAVSRLTVFRDKPEFHNRDNISDRAMLLLGQSLLAIKQPEPARQVFETTIQRFGAGNPVAWEARYGIGSALQNQGKFDEAINAYQMVVAATLTEVAAKAQLQIGHCRHAQKRYADAANAYQTVWYGYAAYPDVRYAAMLEAARAATEDQKPEQATTRLRKLLQEAPANSEWAKSAQERLDKK